MSERGEVTMKRLAADTPDNIFWQIKSATSERQLQMKEMIPLAVVKFLGLQVTAEELGLREEITKYLDSEENVAKEFKIAFILDNHPELDVGSPDDLLTELRDELDAMTSEELQEELKRVVYLMGK